MTVPLGYIGKSLTKSEGPMYSNYAPSEAVSACV